MKKIKRRQELSDRYDEVLGFKGFRKPSMSENIKYNYGYYPIIFDTMAHRDEVKLELESLNIFPRIYFSPSLNTMGYINKTYRCPVSESIASRNLCLPIYPGMNYNVVNSIASIINR